MLSLTHAAGEENTTYRAFLQGLLAGQLADHAGVYGVVLGIWFQHLFDAVLVQAGYVVYYP
jgi:hypothetical protein